ncbi:MAG: hypothetical protein CMC31_00300 [Flavobacteriaceae bacterium]|nr:hypothetical protein [Flavobacteriaceae bacterium]|tara:strand:+ start:3404 stop:4297 length:894 start_codon:yes stop_codon:yes gene_type:complete
MLTQSQNFLPLFPKIDINEYSQVHIIDIENLVGDKPRRRNHQQRENYIRKVNTKLDQYMSEFRTPNSLFIISLAKDFNGLKKYQYKTNKLKNIYSIPSCGISGADNVLITFLKDNFLVKTDSIQNRLKDIYLATGDKDFLQTSKSLNKKFSKLNLVLSEGSSFNKNLIQYCQRCIFLGTFDSNEQKLITFIKHYIYSAIGKFDEIKTLDLIEKINFTYVNKYEPGQKIIESSKAGTKFKLYKNSKESDEYLNVVIELNKTPLKNNILDHQSLLQDALMKVLSKEVKINFKKKLSVQV